MRGRPGGRARVNDIKIRHFGDVDFPTTTAQIRVCIGHAGRAKARRSAKFLPGELALEILFAWSVKAVDFHVKGCQVYKKKKKKSTPRESDSSLQSLSKKHFPFSNYLFLGG